MLVAVHWARYQLLPEGQDQSDLQACLKWSAALLPIAPHLVPEPVRAHLAGPGTPLTPPLPRPPPGTALYDDYQRTGNIELLQNAITLFREAVAAAPADHPDRPGILSSLGAALRTRFGRTGSRRTWNRPSPSAGRRSTPPRPTTPTGPVPVRSRGRAADPVRGAPGSKRTWTRPSPCCQRRSRPPRPATPPARGAGQPRQRAADAVRAHRAAGGPGPGSSTQSGRPSTSLRPTTLTGPGACRTSGSLLWTRFERTGQQADLDQAITTGRQAVDAIPAGHPGRPEVLSNLGNALQTRFERTGQQADLDQAITTGQRGRRRHPGWPPRPARGACPTSGTRCGPGSGAPGSRRTWTRPSPPAGRRSTPPRPTTPTGRGCWPTSGSRCGPGSGAPGSRRTWTRPSPAAGRRSTPPRPITPTGRGCCPTSGSRCGPGSSAPGSRRTWTRPSPGCPRRSTPPRPATPTGHVPVQPRERAADPVRAHRAAGGPGPGHHPLSEAVDATPAGHPGRPGMLSTLGTALRTRFERTGQQADLDQAITWLPGGGRRHPGRPPRPARVPVQPRGRAADPVRAHRAAGGPGPGHHRRPARPSTPPRPATPTGPGTCPTSGPRCGPGSGAPGSRRTWTRPSPASGEAVDATPADHPDRPALLSNLGTALQARFERTGQQADLDQAITRLPQAVDAAPADHPARPGCCPTSGPRCRPGSSAPGSRRTWTGPSPPVQQAVDATPADHPDRPGRLSNLGNALQARFERTGQQADLDQAITARREAVDATPAGHPDRPGCLSNLGSALRTRFARTGQQADLDQAITPASEAVDATPADHPDRPGTCPTSGPRCRPGSSAPGSRRTWTRPYPSPRRRRHPGRPPRPGRVAVQPRDRAAGPVRAHRAASGPGPGPRGVPGGRGGPDRITWAARGGGPAMGPVRAAGGNTGERRRGIHGGDRVAAVGGLAWAGPGDSGASPAGMGRAGV